MNNKTILYNGQVIYPAYMSTEDKEKLKELISGKSNAMFCGCKANVPDDEKLYYRLSADNRFIPLHQGYTHAPDCDRSTDRRSSAFIALDSDESITTYLRFNPLNFTPPVKQTKLEESESTKKNTSTTDKRPKEPYLSLPALIRCINIDAYMERLIAKGVVLSRDYFLNVIKARTKKIKVAGLNKSLRDLNYNDDWCSFFYCTFISLKENERGYWNLTLENNGKTFRVGIRKEVAERVLLNFQKMYSGDSVENEKSIMAAGFIYKRTTRTMKEYYTVGRLHLFKTTTYEGVYCNDNLEKRLYETIFQYIKHRNHNMKLFIPVEQTQYNCKIISKNGYGEVFLGKPKTTDKCITFQYIETTTTEELVKFLDSL